MFTIWTLPYQGMLYISPSSKVAFMGTRNHWGIWHSIWLFIDGPVVHMEVYLGCTIKGPVHGERQYFRKLFYKN